MHASTFSAEHFERCASHIFSQSEEIGGSGAAAGAGAVLAASLGAGAGAGAAVELAGAEIGAGVSVGFAAAVGSAGGFSCPPHAVTTATSITSAVFASDMDRRVSVRARSVKSKAPSRARFTRPDHAAFRSVA